MKTKQININGQELTMKTGMKSFMIFESITGKAFQITNTSDLLCLIYSCIMSGSPECKLDFDTMLDWLDDNPTMIPDLRDFVLGKSSLEEVVNASEGGTESKKA